MKRSRLALLPITALVLSTTLALLGHFYLVYRPEYRADALIFYAAASLLGWWLYARLAPPTPRDWLIMAAAIHIVALAWAMIGGRLAWLALVAGAVAAMLPLPIWLVLAQPLYQAAAGVFGGAPAGYAGERDASLGRQQPGLREAMRRQPGLTACALALGMAILAQLLLNRHTTPIPGTLLYLVAAGVLAIGLWLDTDMWRSLPLPPGPPSPDSSPRGDDQLLSEAEKAPRPSQRWWLIYLAVAAGILNLAFSGNNRFSTLGVLMWVISVASIVLALWEPGPQAWWSKWRSGRCLSWIDVQGIHLSWWTLLVIALVGLGIFFRFYRLAELPAEINSDHAEKLLDVHDILAGKTPIFFPRNTGREAWQFYWTAGLVRLFHLPPDFQALKIGSSLVGALMLPGLYVLGTELFGPLGGAWALLFGGVSSWSVITTRFGLRYPFMQMPVTWTLALLARGLRRERRNDFILMGLIWGLGFYGYQSYRAMAGALPVAFVTWYVLSRRWRRPGQRQLWGHVAATLSVAALVLIPMIRFSLDYPDLFWRRILSRLTGAEQAIDGSPALIFLDNVRRALLAFFWYTDEVWVAGIPNTPIIDPILGALIVCGLVTGLAWSLRRKDALPAAALAATLVMVAPSAAAIAFPRENPSAIRMGGMIAGVMAACAALPALASYHLWQVKRQQRWPAVAAAGVLAAAVVGINAQRTFDTYASQYCARSLNASEVAQAIEGFTRTGGPNENVFYVAFPHWFDSRAIGMWLGDIYWPNTLLDIRGADRMVLPPGPRLYIVHPDDVESLGYLQSVYPRGWVSRQPSQRCPGHDFMVYYVPAN
ncbi:MAG: glycosyltransferase family 39 protein [Thermoflexales bacterium]|nr:glycosyltransferase family 39 protein [Thermoflexales bacterium]